MGQRTGPRFEGWTNLECNGGTRWPVGGFLTVSEAVSIDSLDPKTPLRIAIPGNSESVAYLRQRQIIRVWHSDSDFEEHPIAQWITNHGRGGRVEITCEPLLFRLGDSGLVDEWQTDPIDGKPQLDVGVVGQTLEEIIQTYAIDHPRVSALLPWLTIGTIEPTTLIDLSWSSASLLAVIRGGIDALEALGVLCELQLRRVSNTSYAIDVLNQIGSSAPVVSLKMGRNLKSLTRTDDSARRYTRIAPVAKQIAGAATYLGQARFLVTDVTGDVVTLEDPAGGAGPIGQSDSGTEFDNQHVGLFLYSERKGTSSEITASDESAQTVTVDDASDFAEGDYVEFRVDADGNQPYYLNHPIYSSTTDPGIGVKFGTIDRSNVVGVSNVVPNSVTRTWTDPDDMPDGWTYSANANGIPTTPGTTGVGSVAQNTDPLYTQLGGKSLQFACYVGQIMTPPVPWVPWYDHQRMSIRLRMLLTQWSAPGSQMRMTLGIRLADDSVRHWMNAALFLQPTNFRQGVWQPIAAGGWVDAVINGIDITEPSVTYSPYNEVRQSDIDALATTAKGLVVTLFFSADVVGPPSGQAITGFLDAVSLTPSDTAVEDTDLTEFGGANRLWTDTNVALRFLAPKQLAYAVDVHDLERLNPTLTHDAITKGGTGLVTDVETAIRNERQRIIEIERNLLKKGETRITVAAHTKRFTDLLLRSGAGGRTSGVNGPGTTTTGTGGPPTNGGGTPTPPVTVTPPSGPGSTGLAAPILNITLDSGNVPTADALVQSTAVRVKFAGRLDRFPTEAEVRAEASDSVAPFSAVFAALDPGATLFVGALAYDASNLESALGLQSKTAVVDDPRGDFPVPLKLWLWWKRGSGLYSDIAMTTPATVDGTEIQRWEDASGNGRHAAAAFATSNIRNPTLDATSLYGGLPTVNFDGTTTDGQWFTLPDMSALTEAEIFVVVKVDADPPGDVAETGLWEFGTATFATHHPYVDSILYEAFGTTVRKTLVDPDDDLTQYHIYSVRSAPSDFEAFLNSVSQGTDLTNVVGFTNQPKVGVAQANTVKLVGNIVELVICTPVTDDTERAAITEFMTADTTTNPVTLTYVRSGGDVVVTATARFATSAKIAASTSGVPSDATVRAATAVTTRPFTATFPAPAAGETLHVAAFAYYATLGDLESPKATLDIEGGVGSGGGSSGESLADTGDVIAGDAADGDLLYRRDGFWRLLSIPSNWATADYVLGIVDGFPAWKTVTSGTLDEGYGFDYGNNYGG